jgi:alpha-tubulin suppressor-like RCC1 family protein
MLACGRNSSAVIDSEGKLLTTGSNKLGQIGHGPSNCKWYFETPNSLKDVRFSYVDCFDGHMAAVDVDGRLFVTGGCFYGQLGIGYSDAKYGFQFLGDWRSAGKGNSQKKMVHVEKSEICGVMHTPFNGERVSIVACGEMHTIALTVTGRAWSTGFNYFGQLGLGDGISRYSFDEILQENFAKYAQHDCRVVNVVAGESYSMMLCQNGNIFSCGRNSSGELGIGDLEDRELPTLVEELFGMHVVGISAGVLHSTAITKDGDLFSWGKGWYGQLGQGHSRDTRVPKKVWIPETVDDHVIMAAAGMQHTLILTRDKTVWVCGRGCHGSLGTGDLGVRMIPFRLDMKVFKQANSDADVISVVAGHHHSGFVTSDGNLYMCGRGDGGNVWFREEKGPAGLSLPLQGFARTKPALVKQRRGGIFKDPLVIGPAIALRKNLLELVQCFLMLRISNKNNVKAKRRSSRIKTKTKEQSLWINLLDPEIFDMIARMVLLSPQTKYFQYHKSVLMLMGA